MKEINYTELREVLKYCVEGAFNKRNTDFHRLGVNDIDFIHEVIEKGEGVFNDLIKDITSDETLQQLIDDKCTDDIVERLVESLSKYEGKNVPPPSNDYDNWWGDYNGTISYLVWCYKEDIDRERRWAERHKK